MIYLHGGTREIFLHYTAAGIDVLWGGITEIVLLYDVSCEILFTRSFGNKKVIVYDVWGTTLLGLD